MNSIEDLLSLDPADNLGMAVNPKLTKILDDGCRIPFGKYQWRLGRSNIVGIVDNVRSLALDWAIELERKGITGSGISFSDEEKNLAQNSGSSITFGDGATVIGNLGQGNTSGHISAPGLNTTDVIALIDRIAPYKANLNHEGVDGARLNQLIDSLKSECAKPAPNASFIKAALVDLRNTMSGAAGSLVASGIIATITELLSSSAN